MTVVHHENYTILLTETDEKTFDYAIYANSQLVYKGDECFDKTCDAIEAAKEVIMSYEEGNCDNDSPTDWYDYYGVRRSDF